MKTDYKTEIADKFIKAMEEGTAPWQRPWESSPFSLKNGVTGRKYTGSNILLLSLYGFSDPRFCTFNQAKAQGWTIKKGSKSAIVRFASKVLKKPEESEEEVEDLEEGRSFFFMKYFHVFNFEQIEGVPELEINEEHKNFNVLPKCEEVIKAFDIEITENKISNEAYYSPFPDTICVPNRERFKTELDFYKTVFHEMAHATGAKHRLNRDFSNFGSQAYAFEELVAEIASFMVGQVLGCGSEPSANNVSYVQSWIREIKKDKEVLFKACSLAEKASNWILKEFIKS